MISRYSPLVIFLAGLAGMLSSAVDATCTCSEVCPSYQGAWEIRSDCPPGGIMECVRYLFDSVVCVEWKKASEGGCACNVFGCNCDGCGCHSRRRLGAPSLIISANADEAQESCEDYDFYMSMTEAERSSYLAEKHCSQQAGMDHLAHDIREILELLADTNKDGQLTCAEFNDANFEVDGLDLCGKLK